MNIAGHKINNWWLIGGGTGLVVVFFLYKRSTSGSSSQSGTDPVTGMPYSQDNTTDPLTGIPYLTEAQQYGSVSAAEQAYSASGATAGGPAAGGSSGYYNALSPTAPANVSYASNAAWSQAVTQGLITLGYSATDVAEALGLYLAGKPLGTAADGVSYLAIVQAAVAEYGPPPVGTFSIIGGPTTPSPTPTPTPAPTPTPTPSTTPAATHPSPVAWVKAQWVNSTSTNVHWPAAAGATSYQVRVTYQTQVTQTHMTTGENFTVTGLTPDHNYGIHVVSIANGQPWAPEASTTVHTPKS